MPNEDGSAEVETLWAVDLGADRYEIANCPFFAYGVSFGDVVFASFDPQEEMPTFQRVLSKSGNRTIRLILDPPVAAGNESEKLLGKLRELGCGYEAATKSYIALNIPPPVDLAIVIAVLVDRDITWERGDPTWTELNPASLRQP